MERGPTPGMGFECPVCGALQADAEHLANHLAFSAMLGRDDHEAWLDDRAPGWSTQGPGDLAPTVADLAPERELPEGAGEHRDAGGFEDELADRGGYGRDQGLDAETERILDEARELTAEMYGVEDGSDGDEDDS